ncbi:hypothetical protein FHW88_000048 [Mucilaginibacter sp. SG538B]|uniref:hypothetical protein n=1 Tax=unclassified Mucilaginibacter TaxID=2617802 RepID=UPI000871302E|nr:MULTISPECIES: hypothetical protein [unclassified Mucilaginibacter]NVM61772.1 hypothetical protein [Mucilaginibacter sp. SG538B]SCW85569.1 hypothetical protein SAMN03159284_05013 [Mucilaginibacter sp. NFR10]
MIRLTRYWFEFDINVVDGDLPPGIAVGCGLTAVNYEDALFILQNDIFIGKQIPPVKRYIEDIDISTLESGHVLPNIMTPSVYRGVWYPQGYSFL